MEAISLIVLEKFILELANSISANCDGMQFELVPVNCVCSDVCSVAIEVPQFPDRDEAVDSTVNLPMQTLTDTQHNSNNAKSSTTDLLRQENMTKYIQYVSKEKGERPRIICSLCAKYPEVVRRFYTKGPLPLICTTGAEARSYTIDNHFQSEHHRQCVATAKLNVMSHHEKLMTVPVLKQISKQNVELANKIGGLMISVFNDAKSLSSSAYSWPSRVVASHIASQYNCNDPFVPHEPSSFDLQYISPTAHRELLHTIVQSHLPEFRRHISSSLALSFRCDASMDRTQTDNQFLLAKIVDQSGEERTLFVGLGGVNEPGADGHLKALKAGANATVGFDTVLKKMNHLSTDGENKNVGQHRGLWKLIEDERSEKSLKHIPLLKSVCAVHSSDLAYKDLCKCVPEIPHLVTKLSSLSTFFHTSARRTADLNHVAEENAFAVLRLPRHFEVRWCEFTVLLIDSVLWSWRALVAYFETVQQQTHTSKNDATGFQKTLTNLDNIKLMCFLSDVLFLVTNLQKRLQADDICITDLKPNLSVFI